jgi:hypothetical protein
MFRELLDLDENVRILAGLAAQGLDVHAGKPGNLTEIRDRHFVEPRFLNRPPHGPVAFFDFHGDRADSLLLEALSDQ